MDRKTFTIMKAGLLCNGMHVDETLRPELLGKYPHFFDKGFIHAVNAKIFDSNICISVAENFSGESGYRLLKDQDGYKICGEEGTVPVSFFQSLPQTGTVVDKLARLHADGCVNIWPSTACCYDTEDQKCKFCSLECEGNKPENIKELAAGLEILAKKYDNFALNFSGGTYRNPDFMVEYWCDLAKEIRKFSNCPIAVEFAPPTDLKLLEKMKLSGINVAIMNLEIANKELRQKICPGKSKISYEHYYEAFEKAVEIFGWGQVSSVLIGGIQNADEIINECEKMASVGVFPTIMPFRPMDNCDLSLLRPCNKYELLEMSRKLGAILHKNNLTPSCQEGCTKCGGCSIENDCFYHE